MIEIKQLLREGSDDKYGLCRLQNIILNVMVYIDNLCTINGIDYYIIGGTALGAVRHGGFIPWDDDLDIAMTRNNYNRFVQLCRSDQFDHKNFFFQEGTVDWTGYMSKVRLLGTYFEENVDDESIPKDKKGIFVDVFPLDNVPQCRLSQYWWYACGKLLVAYEQTTHKRYHAKGLAKKVAMCMAGCLKADWIRRYFERQVIRYNNRETEFIGGHSLVSRFRNTFTYTSLWGKAKRVRFETVSLLAPENITEFLEFYFGDYMKLPPEESRRGHHLMNIDYGIYNDIK